MMLEPSELRDRLSWLVFKNGGMQDPVGRGEHAWRVALRCEEAYQKFYKLAARDELAGNTTAERLQDALRRGLLTEQEAAEAEEYDKARFDVILTDDFSKAYIAGDFESDQQEIRTLTERRTMAA